MTMMMMMNSEFTRNRLSARFRPDPLGSWQHSPRLRRWIWGTDPYDRKGKQRKVRKGMKKKD